MQPILADGCGQRPQAPDVGVVMDRVPCAVKIYGNAFPGRYIRDLDLIHLHLWELLMNYITVLSGLALAIAGVVSTRASRSPEVSYFSIGLGIGGALMTLCGLLDRVLF